MSRFAPRLRLPVFVLKSILALNDCIKSWAEGIERGPEKEGLRHFLSQFKPLFNPDFGSFESFKQAVSGKVGLILSLENT